MKLQKQVAIISATISGISLIFSFVLNIFDLKILTYLSNIFIGLFSSGILICAVAIFPSSDSVVSDRSVVKPILEE